MLWWITKAIGQWAMKATLQCAALFWIVALAMMPACAHAQANAPLKALHEVTLDLDQDGKLDRAAVVEDPASGYAALYVFLGYGKGPLDLARKPTFLKKDLTSDPVTGLAGDGKGALILTFGRVGLGSNQYETRLTIVRRAGDFWIAGLTRSWDMRDSSVGSCDINYLTGKGVAARGNAKSKPLKAKFRPIRLADWSEAKRPNACQ